MAEVTFHKGDEVIVKGLRFTVACAMRRMGILILKLKEKHEDPKTTGESE